MKALKTARFACNDLEGTTVNLVEGESVCVDGVRLESVKRMLALGLISDEKPEAVKPVRKKTVVSKKKKGADEDKSVSGAKENK